MSDIHAAIAAAEARWGIPFKRKTAKEASSSCPFCHQGTDRFLVFANNRYWCRQCGEKGWLDDNESKNLDPTERRLRKLEWEQRRAEIERRETMDRVTALEQMAQQAGLVDRYHANLDAHWQAVERWHDHYGVTYETIASRKLGYCPQCPTAAFSDSLTIPVWYQGTLRNIRHRLLNPDKGGKYRPHMAGLGAMLFNQDDLHTDSTNLLILEGEVKSIIVTQETGLANISTMGKTAFPSAWACDKRFAKFQTVYVCYDPDATDKAREVAGLFGGKGRVVELPVKADDLFVVYGGTAADFMAHLRAARGV